MENSNRRQAQNNNKFSFRGMNLLISVLFMVMALLILTQVVVRVVNTDGGIFNPQSSTLANPEKTGNIDDPQDPAKTDPSKPGKTDPVDTNPNQTTPPTGSSANAEVVSTASIGATGDILMHGPVIYAGKNGNSFDYSDMFEYVAPYYQKYDVMVANLECTLGGTEAGEYEGYPTFNCPDTIVDALKGAGVDLLLTANNHSYDTGSNGFIRTQKVLQEKNMPNLGTQLEENAKEYVVQDINGIKVGMICYTYQTNGEISDFKYDPDRVYLNGIKLSAENSKKVTCFTPYIDLNIFYSELQTQLNAMEAEGAEATVVFIHWGAEYQLSPNNTQKKIAQKLCDMGVDVIIGGHPHVVEPFTTLTSENGNKTYCIYSLGNALSNQTRDTISEATAGGNQKYTEDGMIFGVTFQKWSDGTVEVKEVEIVPTWVEKTSGASTYNGVDYRIYPLDASLETWSTFPAKKPARMTESYNRTMGVVGDGINAVRQALGLDTVETSLTEK